MVKRKAKPLFFIILLSIITVLILSVVMTYNSLKNPVDKNNDENIKFVVEEGMTSKQIARKLKKKDLIKSDKFFLLYIKINKTDSLKATTYMLNQTMDLDEIIATLEKGNSYNPDEVKLTITEGVNMREIAKVISSKTNNNYDSVINKSNDTEYLKKLEKKYWFITKDIYNDNLYYKLEGYLYPDTYILQNKDVTVEYIFDKMLNEMDKHLKEYKNSKDNTLTIHERLTLASMVEKETKVEKDRPLMASTFINRLNANMNLGSDVTAKYANKIDEKRTLTPAEFNINSPYNTRLGNGTMNGKLPVGPISTLSKSSIDAAFNPAQTDYLYFISNIKTFETFFYKDYNKFLSKKSELEKINEGY